MRYDPDFDTSTNDHRLDETYKRARSILEYDLKMEKPWKVKIETLPAGTIYFTVYKDIESYEKRVRCRGPIDPAAESDFKTLRLENVSSHKSNNCNYPENIQYDEIRWYYDKETNIFYIEKKS
jgi:hypothetical protein